MSVQEEISLREYLRQQARKSKDAPRIELYDDFMAKISQFFRLRVAAEEYFAQHPHVAKSKHGALPIFWEIVQQTLDSTAPPEQLITIIAKRHYSDINALLGNLRKVLSRVRQKVAIGRIQQVDSHCLRWLVRQPGRTAAEKGGARQEILVLQVLLVHPLLQTRRLSSSRRCQSMERQSSRQVRTTRRLASLTTATSSPRCSTSSIMTTVSSTRRTKQRSKYAS